MFVHHCSACDQRQLIFLSQFTGLRETDAGVVAEFTCWCGATQASSVALGDVVPA